MVGAYQSCFNSYREDNVVKNYKLLAVASAIALVTGLSGQVQAQVGIDDVVNDQASTGDIVS